MWSHIMPELEDLLTFTFWIAIAVAVVLVIVSLVRALRKLPKHERVENEHFNVERSEVAKVQLEKEAVETLAEKKLRKHREKQAERRKRAEVKHNTRYEKESWHEQTLMSENQRIARDKELERIAREKELERNLREKWRERLEKNGYDPEVGYQKILTESEMIHEKEFSATPEERTSYDRHIPSAVKKYVWERDQGMCVWCSSTENLHFDHIIPISKGGSNTKENVQILCQECNLKKSDKIA